ncbi:hypothetical protein ABZ770_41305 [Streptomyces sp. NPDC006654]|uniref:hypothetical protein n=1 Tax=Streptomyces sp. NPDC006654 TaxID=3156897 RepID=UPI003403BB91
MSGELRGVLSVGVADALRGDWGRKVAGFAGDAVAWGVHQNVSEGFFNLFTTGKFTTSWESFVGGAGAGLASRGVAGHAHALGAGLREKAGWGKLPGLPAGLGGVGGDQGGVNTGLGVREEWSAFQRERDEAFGRRLAEAGARDTVGDAESQVAAGAGRRSAEGLWGGRNLGEGEAGWRFAVEQLSRQVPVAEGEDRPAGALESADAVVGWADLRQRQVDLFERDFKRAVADFRAGDLFEGEYLKDRPGAEAGRVEGALGDADRPVPLSLADLRARMRREYVWAADGAVRAFGNADAPGVGSAVDARLAELRTDMAGRVEDLALRERAVADAVERWESGALLRYLPGELGQARADFEERVRMAHAGLSQVFRRPGADGERGPGTRQGVGGGEFERRWNAYLERITAGDVVAGRVEYLRERDVRMEQARGLMEEAVERFEGDLSRGGDLGPEGRRRVMQAWKEEMHRALDEDPSRPAAGDAGVRRLPRAEWEDGTGAVRAGGSSGGAGVLARWLADRPLAQEGLQEAGRHLSWERLPAEAAADALRRLAYEHALQQELDRAAADFTALAGRSGALGIDTGTLQRIGQDYRDQTLTTYQRLFHPAEDHPHDITAWLTDERTHENAFATALTNARTTPAPDRPAPIPARPRTESDPTRPKSDTGADRPGTEAGPARLETETAPAPTPAVRPGTSDTASPHTDTRQTQLHRPPTKTPDIPPPASLHQDTDHHHTSTETLNDGASDTDTLNDDILLGHGTPKSPLPKQAAPEGNKKPGQTTQPTGQPQRPFVAMADTEDAMINGLRAAREAADRAGRTKQAAQLTQALHSYPDRDHPPSPETAKGTVNAAFTAAPATDADRRGIWALIGVDRLVNPATAEAGWAPGEEAHRPRYSPSTVLPGVGTGLGPAGQDRVMQPHSVIPEAGPHVTLGDMGDRVDATGDTVPSPENLRRSIPRVPLSTEGAQFVSAMKKYRENHPAAWGALPKWKTSVIVGSEEVRLYERMEVLARKGVDEIEDGVREALSQFGLPPFRTAKNKWKIDVKETEKALVAALDEYYIEYYRHGLMVPRGYSKTLDNEMQVPLGEFLHHMAVHGADRLAVEVWDALDRAELRPRLDSVDDIWRIFPLDPPAEADQQLPERQWETLRIQAIRLHYVEDGASRYGRMPTKRTVIKLPNGEQVRLGTFLWKLLEKGEPYLASEVRSELRAFGFIPLFESEQKLWFIPDGENDFATALHKYYAMNPHMYGIPIPRTNEWVDAATQPGYRIEALTREGAIALPERDRKALARVGLPPLRVDAAMQPGYLIEALIREGVIALPERDREALARVGLPPLQDEEGRWWINRDAIATAQAAAIDEFYQGGVRLGFVVPIEFQRTMPSGIQIFLGGFTQHLAVHGVEQLDGRVQASLARAGLRPARGEADAVWRIQPQDISYQDDPVGEASHADEVPHRGEVQDAGDVSYAGEMPYVGEVPQAEPQPVVPAPAQDPVVSRAMAAAWFGLRVGEVTSDGDGLFNALLHAAGGLVGMEGEALFSAALVREDLTAWLRTDVLLPVDQRVLWRDDVEALATVVVAEARARAARLAPGTEEHAHAVREYQQRGLSVEDRNNLLRLMATPGRYAPAPLVLSAAARTYGLALTVMSIMTGGDVSTQRLTDLGRPAVLVQVTDGGTGRENWLPAWPDASATRPGVDATLAGWGWQPAADWEIEGTHEDAALVMTGAQRAAVVAVRRLLADRHVPVVRILDGLRTLPDPGLPTGDLPDTLYRLANSLSAPATAALATPYFPDSSVFDPAHHEGQFDDFPGVPRAGGQSVHSVGVPAGVGHPELGSWENHFDGTGSLPGEWLTGEDILMAEPDQGEWAGSTSGASQLHRPVPRTPLWVGGQHDFDPVAAGVPIGGLVEVAGPRRVAGAQWVQGVPGVAAKGKGVEQWHTFSRVFGDTEFWYEVSSTGALRLPGGQWTVTDAWFRYGDDFVHPVGENTALLLRADTGWIGEVMNWVGVRGAWSPEEPHRLTVTDTGLYLHPDIAHAEGPVGSDGPTTLCLPLTLAVSADPGQVQYAKHDVTGPQKRSEPVDGELRNRGAEPWHGHGGLSGLPAHVRRAWPSDTAGAEDIVRRSVEDEVVRMMRGLDAVAWPHGSEIVSESGHARQAAAYGDVQEVPAGPDVTASAAESKGQEHAARRQSPVSSRKNTASEADSAAADAERGWALVGYQAALRRLAHVAESARRLKKHIGNAYEGTSGARHTEALATWQTEKADAERAVKQAREALREAGIDLTALTVAEPGPHLPGGSPLYDRADDGSDNEALLSDSDDDSLFGRPIPSDPQSQPPLMSLPHSTGAGLPRHLLPEHPSSTDTAPGPSRDTVDHRGPTPLAVENRTYPPSIRARAHLGELAHAPWHAPATGATPWAREPGDNAYLNADQTSGLFTLLRTQPTTTFGGIWDHIDAIYDKKLSATELHRLHAAYHHGRDGQKRRRPPKGWEESARTNLKAWEAWLAGPGKTRKSLIPQRKDAYYFDEKLVNIGGWFDHLIHQGRFLPFDVVEALQKRGLKLIETGSRGACTHYMLKKENHSHAHTEPEELPVRPEARLGTPPPGAFDRGTEVRSRTPEGGLSKTKLTHWDYLEAYKAWLGKSEENRNKIIPSTRTDKQFINGREVNIGEYFRRLAHEGKNLPLEIAEALRELGVKLAESRSKNGAIRYTIDRGVRKVRRIIRPVSVYLRAYRAWLDGNGENREGGGVRVPLSTDTQSIEGEVIPFGMWFHDFIHRGAVLSEGEAGEMRDLGFEIVKVAGNRYKYAGVLGETGASGRANAEGEGTAGVERTHGGRSWAPEVEMSGGEAPETASVVVEVETGPEVAAEVAGAQVGGWGESVASVGGGLEELRWPVEGTGQRSVFAGAEALSGGVGADGSMVAEEPQAEGLRLADPWMQQVAAMNGLVVADVAGDGNCFMNALALAAGLFGPDGQVATAGEVRARLAGALHEDVLLPVHERRLWPRLELTARAFMADEFTRAAGHLPGHDLYTIWRDGYLTEWELSRDGIGDGRRQRIIEMMAADGLYNNVSGDLASIVAAYVYDLRLHMLAVNTVTGAYGFSSFGSETGLSVYLLRRDPGVAGAEHWMPAWPAPVLVGQDQSSVPQGGPVGFSQPPAPAPSHTGWEDFDAILAELDG